MSALCVAGGALSGCAHDKGPNLRAYTERCPPISAGYYCVWPGDTLKSVSREFGHPPQDVARWNDLSPAAALHAGQMLRMAPLEAHVAAAHAAGAAGTGHAAAQFVWPAGGMVIREFGENGSRGIEIAGRAGAPIKAAAAGRVVYAGDGIKTYGLMVIVKHGDGYVTAYGNNRRLLVREGDTVQQSAAIAEMGTHGDGGARLQFEMREGGHAVDPLAHLPADSGPVVE